MLLRILTLASLLALAAPAVGAQLAIEGDWGDASGCGWMTGDGDYDIDNMIMLRPDWISGYIFSCEIADIATAGSGAQLVSGICHQEGTLDNIDVRQFVLRQSTSDKIEIFFGDGTKWGEVAPC